MDKKHFKDLEPGDVLIDMHDHTSLRDELPFAVAEPVQIVKKISIRGPGGLEFIAKQILQHSPAFARHNLMNKCLYVIDIDNDGNRIVAYSYDDRVIVFAVMEVRE